MVMPRPLATVVIVGIISPTILTLPVLSVLYIPFRGGRRGQRAGPIGEASSAVFTA